MRFLSFVLAGSVCFTLAGCGLDANGLLGEGDDGGPTLSEAAAPVDGTVLTDDASGNDDATLVVDTGPPGDDSGGDDVTSVKDTGADTGRTDAGADGSADTGADTGTDAADAAPADAGTDAADAADACGPVEICNNGIDDNCNGLIDCADPECTPAWTCTTGAVPTGWSIVEYVETSRPACSTGYGSSVDVVEGPAGAPATCACGCDVTTTGSCEEGNFTVTVTGGLGAGCSTIPVTSAGNGGACSAATVNYNPQTGAKMEVSTLGYTGGGCTPDAGVTVSPVTYAGQGRVCKDVNGSGAGCANGGSCAPAQGGGFSLCIAHGGVVACPTGFTLPAHTVGSGVTDTRGCTACSCGTAGATCANPTLSMFTASDCAADGGESVPANGQCNTFPGPTGAGGFVGGGPTYVAYEYTAQVQGEACPPSAVAPDGGVALTGAQTVCCQ